MRIALLTGDLSFKGAGVRQVVEGLSLALSRLGLDVEVFGLETADWVNGDDKKWRGAPARVGKVRGPASFGYSPDMARLLREFDPDVVHVHGIWQYPSLVALNWHRATGRPIFLSPHGMLHPLALAQAAAKKWLVRRLYVDKTIDRAAALVSTTPEETAQCVAFGKTGEIVEIPNGVDVPDDLSGTRPQAPWRGKLDNDRPVMMFLGRFHPTKNLSELLEAWSILHHREGLKSWQLAIVGWGSDAAEAQVRDAIGPLVAAGAKVALTGPLFGEDKLAALRNASAFVLPSRNESFAVSVLEAWGASLPTLVSAACNVGFAVDEGAAFEVRTTPVDLAEDLAAFIALSPEDRNLMAQRGRRLVSERFSWPVLAQLHEELYAAHRSLTRTH